MDVLLFFRAFAPGRKALMSEARGSVTEAFSSIFSDGIITRVRGFVLRMNADPHIHFQCGTSSDLWIKVLIWMWVSGVARRGFPLTPLRHDLLY